MASQSPVPLTKEDVDLKKRASKFKSTIIEKHDLKPLHEYIHDLLNNFGDNQKINSEITRRLGLVIAGGLTFEEFETEVKKYDASTMCGKVWGSGDVAFKCRTCAVVPNMAICSSCFDPANHKGHDWNKYNTEISGGGACDCGCPDIMSPEGFCIQHKPGKDKKAAPPEELMAMPREMISCFIQGLLFYFRTKLYQDFKRYKKYADDNLPQLENFMKYLHRLSAMGTPMKEIFVQVLMDEAQYKSWTEFNERSKYEAAYKKFLKHTQELEYPASFDGYRDQVGMGQPHVYKNALEELAFWIIYFDLPILLVTLLMGFFPDADYKMKFGVILMRHYPQICTMYVETQRTQQINHMWINMTGQLFSIDQCAIPLVEQHHVAYVAVLGFKTVLEKPREKCKLTGGGPVSHTVLDFTHDLLLKNIFWPLFCDLHNMLSHEKNSLYVLAKPDLLSLYLDLLSCLQGANVISRNIRNEDFDYDYTVHQAFNVENKMGVFVMWDMLKAFRMEEACGMVDSTIKTITSAIQQWFEAISFHSPLDLNCEEVTLHLPLHRFLSGFVHSAVNFHGMDLSTLLPDKVFLKKIMTHILQIQVVNAQIGANMWQETCGEESEVNPYNYHQSQNAYSILDLDIHMLQVCAASLDPDEFLLAVLNGFNINSWLSFDPLFVNKDGQYEEALVEACLSFLSILLGVDNYLGISENDLIRKELTTKLFKKDNKHSKLRSGLPKKATDYAVSPEKFEEIFCKVAGQKGKTPASESPTYHPTDSAWENDFDPIYSLHRSCGDDYQETMTRYRTFLQDRKGYKKKTSPWPPFRITEEKSKPYLGLLRLVNCKTMHALLFTVLLKVSKADEKMRDGILFYAVHLLNVCLHFASPSCIQSSTPISVQNGNLDKWFETTDICTSACVMVHDVKNMSALAVEDIADRPTSSVDGIESKVAVEESIISLLIKLHDKQTENKGYSPKEVPLNSSLAEPLIGGDGDEYISRLLDHLYSRSDQAKQIIDILAQSHHPEVTSRSDNDARRASKRKEKLMAQIKSKQQEFLNAMDVDAATSDEEQGDTSTTCIVCNQAGTSKKNGPLALPIFFQVSGVIGHMHRRPDGEQNVLGPTESEYMTFLNSTFANVKQCSSDILRKHFDEKFCKIAFSNYWDHEIVTQSCGHSIHIGCFNSYTEAKAKRRRPRFYYGAGGNEMIFLPDQEDDDDDEDIAKCLFCRHEFSKLMPLMLETGGESPSNTENSVDEIMSLLTDNLIEEILDEETRDNIDYFMTELVNISQVKQSGDQMLQFIVSHARMNLEAELFRRTVSPSFHPNAARKACFLPLLRVFNTASKSSSTPVPYAYMFASVAGLNSDFGSSRSTGSKPMLPVLLWDAQNILIYLIMGLPITVSEVQLESVLSVLFNLVCVQSLVSIACSWSQAKIADFVSKNKQTADETTIDGLLKTIINSLPLTHGEMQQPSDLTMEPEEIDSKMMEYCLPFLKLSALVKEYLFQEETSIKQVLKKGTKEEFQELISYLHLDSPSSKAISQSQGKLLSLHWVVSDPGRVISAWCRQFSTAYSAHTDDIKTIMLSNPVWQRPRLIKLPTEYYEVFERFRQAKCPACDEVPAYAMICLVCGILGHLEGRDDKCKGLSKSLTASKHTCPCQRSTGIFLYVPTSNITVKTYKTSKYWGYLYVDRYGEADDDLKRGVPLFLDESRYKTLENQWLSHSLR